MAQQTPLELVNHLQQLVQSSETKSNSKELRLEACGLAYKLFREFEEPGDMINRMIYQGDECPVITAANDLNIFDSVIRSEDGVSSTDIAAKTKADPAMVSRILRYLASHGHIAEVDVDLYKANKCTKAFLMPRSVAGFRVVTDIVYPSWRKLPALLKATGYQTPVEPLSSPIQHAFNSSKHFFDILIERDMMSSFQTLMTDSEAVRDELVDVFPAEDRLFQGYEPSKNAVLIVDVAGGRGHEIMKIVEKFPEAKGRKILQDTPDVLKDVESTKDMEVCAYDFFTPQPVQGARCYHFRRIFHDWPNSYCLKILKNTTSAMKPGYPRILINDIVLPNKGLTREVTGGDIAMMVLLSSLERSESQWHSLLEAAGLKIIKIWPGVPESVIEAELA